MEFLGRLTELQTRVDDFGNVISNVSADSQNLFQTTSVLEDSTSGLQIKCDELSHELTKLAVLVHRNGKESGPVSTTTVPSASGAMGQQPLRQQHHGSTGVDGASSSDAKPTPEQLMAKTLAQMKPTSDSAGGQDSANPVPLLPQPTAASLPEEPSSIPTHLHFAGLHDVTPPRNSHHGTEEANNSLPPTQPSQLAALYNGNWYWY